MDAPLEVGHRVRVKRDCPLTLPAFAQMTQGRVEAFNEDDTVEVRFASDRTFPIPVRWVERVPGGDEEE